MKRVMIRLVLSYDDLISLWMACAVQDYEIQQQTTGKKGKNRQQTIENSLPCFLPFFFFFFIQGVFDENPIVNQPLQ